MSFGVEGGEWSLQQKAWPPVCVFCLSECVPLRRLAEAPPSPGPVLPCCPQDKPHQCTASGGVCPAAGCFRVPRNLDVLLAIWSSSEQNCDKLETQGHSCEHQQLKGVFVSRLPHHLGRSPGAKEKGGGKGPVAHHAVTSVLRSEGSQPGYTNVPCPQD